MSFSGGFKDGFSYYLAFADEERKRREFEQNERLITLREKEGESRASYYESLAATAERERLLMDATPGDYTNVADKDIPFSVQEMINRTEKSRIDLKTSELNLNITNTNLDVELLKLNNVKDQESLRKIVNVSNLLSNDTINPTVAASMLEETLVNLRDNEALDFTKFVSEEYWQGWERIAPYLENGDFETIANDHSDVLTTIFSERLKVFEGKNFIASDGREGTIKNVSFSGYNPVADSANMLIQGDFVVDFNGVEETLTSYLPDNVRAQKNITQDTEGNDAGSVSIADVVDRVSAEKDFAMFLVNNPDALETFKNATKGMVRAEDVDPRYSESLVKTYTNLKKEGERYIGDVWSRAEKSRLDTVLEKDKESAFLESIYFADPGLGSQYINIIPDATKMGGDLFEYKEGASQGGLQDAWVSKYADPEGLWAEVNNLYSSSREIYDISDGRQPFYFILGTPHRLDTPREQIELFLQNRLQSNRLIDYNALNNEAAQQWENLYNTPWEEVDSQKYLAFMSAFIEAKGL